MAGKQRSMPYNVKVLVWATTFGGLFQLFIAALDLGTSAVYMLFALATFVVVYGFWKRLTWSLWSGIFLALVYILSSFSGALLLSVVNWIVGIELLYYLSRKDVRNWLGAK